MNNYDDQPAHDGSSKVRPLKHCGVILNRWTNQNYVKYRFTIRNEYRDGRVVLAIRKEVINNIPLERYMIRETDNGDGTTTFTYPNKSQEIISNSHIIKFYNKIFKKHPHAQILPR